MTSNGTSAKANGRKPSKNDVIIDFSGFKTIRDVAELGDAMLRHATAIEKMVQIVKAHPMVEDPSDPESWWNLSPPDWREASELFREKFDDIYKR